MTSTFGFVTIGGSPVQLPAFPMGATKITFQIGKSATGTVKIGGSSGMAADDSTGGLYLPANPGILLIESESDENTLHPEQYFIHGTVSGDKVMWQVNQA